MLILNATQWGELLTACQHAMPCEACGLLVGHSDTVLAIVPLPNQHPQPERSFFAAPAALLAAYCLTERNGWQVLAVYHSHPNGSNTLSAADLHGMAHLPVPWLLASWHGWGWHWRWFAPPPAT